MIDLDSPAHLRGPNLVDHMFKLLDASGIPQEQLRARYGFGITWLSDVRRGQTKSPNAHLVQLIIEDLSGEPLVKEAI